MLYKQENKNVGNNEKSLISYHEHKILLLSIYTQIKLS